MEWSEIHKKFMEIIKMTGRTEDSSGMMKISFNPNDGSVNLYFGTYDVAYRSRHSEFGPFKTEDEAKKFAIKEIEIMEKEVIDYLKEPKDVDFY